jgi:hypothetical protein
MDTHRKPDDVRPAIDAEDCDRLKDNPKDKDAKLDVEIDESFPASDPPSQTQRPKSDA